MKRTTKKLDLARTTLRHLTPAQLAEVAGARTTLDQTVYYCPTAWSACWGCG